MIFVTVGSDVPFSRLVNHLDHWSRNHPEEKVFAQVGHLGPGDYRPTSMTWTEMLSPDEFARNCAEARIIVAHAGMGSIISALSMAKPIVVLPRNAQWKETRNDHQFATAERFAGRPGLLVAWTEADLPVAIREALNQSDGTPLQQLQQYAPVEFTDRLREFILGSVQSQGH